MILLPRTTDNSTYFTQSLEIRGIESRLYVQNFIIKDILKKKRCSLNFCTDYKTSLLQWTMYPSAKRDSGELSRAITTFVAFLD